MRFHPRASGRVPRPLLIVKIEKRLDRTVEIDLKKHVNF